MIKRYDRIVERGYPDNCSIMYGNNDGYFVKYDDHKDKIDFAIEILNNLKNCKVSLNSPEELNLIVDRAIENLK